MLSANSISEQNHSRLCSTHTFAKHHDENLGYPRGPPPREPEPVLPRKNASNTTLEHMRQEAL